MPHSEKGRGRDTQVMCTLATCRPTCVKENIEMCEVR